MDILNIDEKDVLNKIFDIKRKTDKFWGMWFIIKTIINLFLIRVSNGIRVNK
jgi:hypothetical protein